MKRLLGITVVLLLTATPAYANSYEEGDEEGRNSGRHCEGSQDCSSLSPSFEDSPVTLIVCVEPESCRF